MRADPGGGGPDVNGTGDLILINTQTVNALKGTWEAYLQALVTFRGNCYRAIPSATDWQGDRADRFRAWCTKAGSDLDRVQGAISAVVESLGQYLAFATTLNDQMAWAAMSVKDNVSDYWVNGAANSIGGTVTLPSTQVDLKVTGTTITGIMVDQSQWPQWLQSLQESLFSVSSEYGRFVGSCDQILRPALGQLGGLHQFSILARKSAMTPSPLGDATWAELAGTDIIRPTTTGFVVNPYGTDIMPGWYQPTGTQNVANFIGKYGWGADVAALVTTLIGQPEIGAGIEILVHGVKLGADLADNDTKDVPWDAVSLAFDYKSVGDVSKSLVESIMEHPDVDLPAISPELAKNVTDYVEGKLQDALKDAVVGDDGKPEISAATLADIAAEAQAKLDTLAAAGLTS